MTFIGITIGPIVDTMMLTSTPIGLWFASYFFSHITERLCEEFQTIKDDKYDVFSLPPNFKAKEHETEYPGVGRYHDRVYLSTDKNLGDIKTDVETVISKVIESSARELCACFEPKDEHSRESVIRRELKDYLQIHYVIIPEENLDNTLKGNKLARNLADALDSLELSLSIDKLADSSHLRKVINGNKEEGSNCYLKEYEHLKIAVEEAAKKAAEDKFFTLAEKAKDGIIIHDLKWLATHGKSSEDSAWLNNRYGSTKNDNYKFQKTEKYFAIVQCDGDNMGGQLATGTDKATLEEEKNSNRSFSDKCMQYASESARIVSRYGGFVIYAGGDDLLFLAPVIGKANEQSDETIFDLCNEIAGNFNLIFKDEKKDDSNAGPSLSFGVSINYYRFPLYEAFADASDLLFNVAKGYTDKKRLKKKHKNNIAVKLHKASGQTSGFVCCMNTNKDAGEENNVYESIRNLINSYFCNDLNNDIKDAEQKNNVMHSILYKMETFKTLFDAAYDIGIDKVNLLYDNMFDNILQTFGKNMRNEVYNLSKKIHECPHKEIDEDNKIRMGENVYVKGLADTELVTDAYTVSSILRMAKFFLEED
ncbi:MAG: type III-B CRISPR-associated protein Cas10/Cmr2 [Lachnospiraceae bacterium]|nr:type III-B CRISPR-associated protein Cas10/Cmr2 [Lachnospiraceae bacterium]